MKRSLQQSVARVTGESVQRIRRMGFSLVVIPYQEVRSRNAKHSKSKAKPA